MRFHDTLGFSWKNNAFFGRRSPLPDRPDFLQTSDVDSVLHNAFLPLPQVRQGSFMTGGRSILVLIITMAFPHTGQVIDGRLFKVRIRAVSGFTRSTTCRKLMSFLLHGWRKP